VVEHCQRLSAADLSHPIIIDATGRVLDGVHRVAKAVLQGLTTVRAVRLSEMPEADEVLDSSDPRYEGEG